VLAQVAEVVAEDGLPHADLAVDLQGRRGEVDPALSVAEVHHEVVAGAADPVQRVDEVHVPRGAAELAVGGGLQPDVLLHPDDVADRVVLGRAQLRVVDAPIGVVGAGAQQPLWAEQAPDVVGAERRLGTRCGHLDVILRRLCES
jgi:hypothetical protein